MASSTARFWGRGYATEAARAAIDDGFQRVGLQAIVAMTVPANQRLAAGHAAPWHDAVHRVRSSELRSDHPLCRHVLYRLP